MNSDCISVENDVVSESVRQFVLDWISNNESLDSFNTTTVNESTDREAFAVTYTRSTLPTQLQYFVAPKTNVYNFVGIITRKSGDIPTHTDDDLTCEMREAQLNPLYVKLPHTTSVHYVDICEQMSGGDTIFECEDKQVTVPSTQNAMVTFPSSVPHSVTAIESTTKPRVVLVCEKYYMLGPGIRELSIGEYRSG